MGLRVGLLVAVSFQLPARGFGSDCLGCERHHELIVRRRTELICKCIALFSSTRLRRNEGARMGRGSNAESGGSGLRLALQVVEEPVEGFLVGVVVFPVAEVGDMELADLTG